MAHKAPGKHHREGISLMKLFKMFPDNSAAEKWFAKARWPEGTHCPHCESVNVQSGAAHKSMPYRCRERECRKRFSVRTGTCMEASNLGFQIWAIAVYLMSTSLKGVSSMKLHRDLGITQKSAWHLAMRLRKALEDDGANLPFVGPDDGASYCSSHHVVDRSRKFCWRSSGDGHRERRRSAWRRISSRSMSACRMIQGAPLQCCSAGSVPSAMRRRMVD